MSRVSSWIATLLFLVLAAGGCTGLTFGENRAGSDTYLDDGRPPEDPGYVGTGEGWCVYNGSIAVDHRTETAFTLVSSAEVECADLDYHDPVDKALYAVRRGSRTPEKVMDLTDRDDTRILFPAGRVLVMSEEDGRDRLTLLDAESFEVVDELRRSVRYHGTRLSATRRYVAVADNTSADAPIHIIDTRDFGTTVIRHSGDWLEAMWLHGEDVLTAIIFYNWEGLVDCEGDGCTIGNHCSPETYARIVTWDVSGRSAEEIDNHPEEVWGRPGLDITVDGVCADMLFSFTWIGVSGDDRVAAFPVLRYTGEGEGEDGYVHEVLLVDLATGDVTPVADARGPVGFTPDGSTMVTYRYVPEPPTEEDPEGRTTSVLVLVDVETLEETLLPLEMLDYGPEFYVTPLDNFVVITTPFGGDKLVIHDVDGGETTELDSPGWTSLDEFVSRDRASELWLVDEGLYRLDYIAPSIEEVGLEFVPSHINLLPRSDLLVLDDPRNVRLVFFDPMERAEVRDVMLPTP